MNTERELADIIRSNRDRLSEAVINSMFINSPKMKDKYEDLFERLVSDVQFHFDYLAEAIDCSSVALIKEYVKWILVFFKEINVPQREISFTFRLMQKELYKKLTQEQRAITDKYFELLISELENEEPESFSYLDGDYPLKELSDEYFNLLIDHKRREAATLLTKALESGISIKDIYLQVFQRAQWEIGRLWQTKRITVAEEHTFTAATQMIMSQIYPYLFRNEAYKGKVLAACVGRELHEIGIRMVADFLEMDGWDSIYLGANSPTKTVYEAVVKERPDILALSTTIMPHLKQLREIIKMVRQDHTLNYIKILVGGYPFNTEKNLWKQVNADGFAENAEMAAVEVKRLTD